MNYRAVATCLFGLEKVVEFELKRLGIDVISVSDGRVSFEGTKTDIARANINCSTAERILIVLDEFDASDFDSLFDKTGEVVWGDIISEKDSFPVKGYSINSTLTSVPACQRIIKKSIAERLKRDLGVRSLPENGRRKIAIRFSIVSDRVTLMVDTSGEGLHKRGYRPNIYGAPIKETLAAGISDFARIGQNSTVTDPFCGTGTLIIESALRANRIAPGLNRHFAAESYPFIGKGAFDFARKEARENIVRNSKFTAVGTDIDPKAIEHARFNAKAAKVDEFVKFEVMDARKYIPSKDMIVVTNPPYGEKLMDPVSSGKLIGEFCENFFKYDFKGLYLISGQPDFEDIAGKKAKRRRKLYNGMIVCQLYMYF
ncbi:MAG: class I SAM-dependent RNA methyltransferase [Ruminococcaceae bacterium]|nr:class I SAM-dependent RNA methyltransferase [Oscillospiraceae bacterium]